MSSLCPDLAYKCAEGNTVGIPREMDASGNCVPLESPQKMCERVNLAPLTCSASTAPNTPPPPRLG